jgi:hypothetical protein
MRWLHSDDAKRLGIAADELSNLNIDKQIISVEKYGPEWKLKSEAITFVRNFFNQWSVLSESGVMSALATSYSNKVEYNGAIKTAAEVLADKKKWRQRWPVVDYKLRLESMVTNCSDKTHECIAAGVVD